MNIKRIIKKIGIFFLCFLLLFFAVFFSYAKTTKAVVPALALGASAIVAFFSAAGISLTAQNIANNQSMTDAINNIANEYSNSTGAPTLEETIATQNALNFYRNEKTAEAFVSMSDSVAEWCNGLKNWFVQNFALTDSGESVIFEDQKFTTYDGKSYLYYTDFSQYVDGKKPASSVPLSESPYVVNLSQNYYLVVQCYDDGFQYNYYRPGIRFQIFDRMGNLVGTNGHRYASSLPHDYSNLRACFYRTWQGIWGITCQPIDAGSYATSGYTYLFGNIMTNNDVTTSSIGLSGSLTDGYDDFAQALNDARTDAGENGQIAIGVGDVSAEKPYTEESIAEGILDNSIANTGEGILVGGYADDREVEDETSATKVPSIAQIGEGIVIVDGLEDFFPFCIPFDLYEIIKLLNVAPEAPKFNWKMGFGDTGINDYDIEIDLSPYETVAVIFRTLVIIGFLIFLTLKTRDLIRG